jgi:predicted dehydrogenase
MADHSAVRVGIIGRGFGARVVAPVFQSTEGCEVVDVVSPRDERAVAALCARGDVDLISVHSPPFLHLDHVRRAIEGRHAVLCDKPFGRSAEEAREMCRLADEAGVVALVNFEMRFDPAHERLRALVLDGAVGNPEHLQRTLILATTRVPLRPYGWLFAAELGGGWLRAYGSHVIDFARWSFGEILDGSAELRTAIGERPDANGSLHGCTADDGFTAILRSVTGVTIAIDSTSTASASLSPTMLVIGDQGVLEVIGDKRIIRHTERGRDEIWALEQESANPLPLPMRRWASIVRAGVGRGAADAGAPTFADGLACVRVMDALRASTTDQAPSRSRR